MSAFRYTNLSYEQPSQIHDSGNSFLTTTAGFTTDIQLLNPAGVAIGIKESISSESSSSPCRTEYIKLRGKTIQLHVTEVRSSTIDRAEYLIRTNPLLRNR